MLYKEEAVKQLQKISRDKILKFFLEKQYSLELLFLLNNEIEIEGLEKTYQDLKSPKPKYPAFKTYINYLEQKNCIKIKSGKTKKSSKILELSNEAKVQFSKIII